MSLRASEVLLASTRLGLPTPAPWSANMLACSLVHFFHSLIIFSSSTLRFSGEVFIHSSTTACGARYRTRNFAMSNSSAKTARRVTRALKFDDHRCTRLRPLVTDGFVRRSWDYI